MWARISTIQGSPERVDGAIHQFQEQLLPVTQGLAGFRGAHVLVDRKTGKFVGITLWETERALRASEAVLNRLRAQAAEAIGTIDPPAVEIYEVAFQG